MRYSINTKVHVGITVAVMLFIFVQSAMPGDLSGAESNFVVQIIVSVTGLSEELLSLLVRKAAHFTEFMVLGVCLSVNTNDLIESGRLRWIGEEKKPGRIWMLPWIAGTLYACTDELHQLFVTDRACSLTDVLIDSAGVAFGVAVYAVYRKLRLPKEKRLLRTEKPQEQ